MSGKKSQSENPDLTTPEAVARGQKVYDRIASGQCKDVRSELDAAYGQDGKRKRAN
ncbi:hypothetical protein [Streptomyces sp. NPDC005302]|uniref:hypothetical protein n=1 Tax=Streptomyces sp. NPDC005302 TaxID=3154675 RepID=UPI0033AA5184